MEGGGKWKRGGNERGGIVGMRGNEFSRMKMW